MVRQSGGIANEKQAYVMGVFGSFDFIFGDRLRYASAAGTRSSARAGAAGPISSGAYAAARASSSPSAGCPARAACA